MANVWHNLQMQEQMKKLAAQGLEFGSTKVNIEVPLIINNLTEVGRT